MTYPSTPSLKFDAHLDTIRPGCAVLIHQLLDGCLYILEMYNFVYSDEIGQKIKTRNWAKRTYSLRFEFKGEFNPRFKSALE